MTPADLISYQRYCQESLEILNTAVELYQQGSRSFYRVAAIQLRLLLCDTTRRHGRQEDISLLPRLLPDLTLPTLSPDGKALPDASEIPLDRWLEQTLMDSGQSISVRLLIRRVCDQDGGAHIDPKPRAGLTHFSRYPDWIIHIAEIIVRQIPPLLT
jgi:hypothetical protein